MEPLVQKILVVGGNGFIGSAVCRAALARGIQVTSISSSGRPYRTPKGHAPAWVSKVEWRKADALVPETYADLLPNVDGVVHTIGILLEDRSYKGALARGDIPKLFAAFSNGRDRATDSSFGPASGVAGKGTYEVLNRDSALRVCETFVASKPANHDKDKTPESAPVRPFVYISAEDISQPIVPARYIQTKHEAEQRISHLLQDHPRFRAVFIRPSLVYHAHQRPLVSPFAALIDLSASLHARIPTGVPTPSSVLRMLGSKFSSTSSSSREAHEHTRPGTSPSSSSTTFPNSGLATTLNSMANALTIPPIHVDHVAEAICVALDPQRTDVKGVVGVKEMRELIGWS
ncbi:hypothetical protein BKA82DRAFT_993276 [Pisolithus tinctorius]|uniref:NAD-dependent epimerase/dehydratase domain-containing protein n=1 Tax=Pisolithus tinctorius Marx 270 TaxID=870435 RepID=A0A0C3PXL8_PISTI|nr:hypothetical protein BKA82DRAFT_993276 [Pisolithus tinctorius]KIO13734.1 hypothetical protein M404DRAFT_993276 [Pisolithus tinctorius Marx 270]